MAGCKLILDTDIDMDVDDVGAIALCHSLADRGEMELLGVICDSASSPAAACVHVINASRNRPELPVGTIFSTALSEKLNYEHFRQAIPQRGNVFYNQAIADMDPVASARPVWNSTKLYRKLLSEAEDGSVTICCIGFLTAVADLLRSGPDEWSPLRGRELVACKVKMLISMAEANSEVGYDVCNWMIDRDSAAEVLHHWPAELVVTPLGRNVWTGKTLSDVYPEDDPVRQAYEIYMCGPNISQQSWDLIAVYYAVRGCEDLFQECRGKHCYLHADNGLYHWAGPSLHCREHILLDQIAEDKAVEAAIEPLLDRSKSSCSKKVPEITAVSA